VTGMEETLLTEKEMERAPVASVAIREHGPVLEGETAPQSELDLPQTKAASPTTSKDQGERADPKDVQSGSPVIMMLYIGAPE